MSIVVCRVKSVLRDVNVEVRVTMEAGATMMSKWQEDDGCKSAMLPVSAT